MPAPKPEFPMHQVIQDIRSGRTSVRELPDPIAGPGQLVVATAASLISAGTERYVVELAKKSLLGKARQRPVHGQARAQHDRDHRPGATARWLPGYRRPDSSGRRRHQCHCLDRPAQI